MTRDLDTPLEITLGVIKPARARYRDMSFMTWTKLTVHWIVSDCDLEKVSVYTPSKGCVGIYVVRIIYRC